MSELKKKIPFCPMLSSGDGELRVCLQDSCAWYMQGTKTCALYVVAHKSILDIKEKQQVK